MIVILLLLIITHTTSTKKLPNFLVFVADDLGRYDTSITNPNAPTVRNAFYVFTFFYRMTRTINIRFSRMTQTTNIRFS